MDKPSNWDETEAKTQGEFETILPGGYVAKILNAITKTSSKGNQMIELSLDIAEGEHAGFYANLSDKLNKDISLKIYQLTEGESTSYFKGLVNAIEHSNPNFIWDFDEKHLIGKRIGVNLREEEYRNDAGEVKISLRVGYYCSAEEARAGLPLMKKKLLPDAKSAQTQTAPVGTVSNGADKDLPF
jgi:hypothetical protein